MRDIEQVTLEPPPKKYIHITKITTMHLEADLTKDDNHMQRGDISWRFGFGSSAISVGSNTFTSGIHYHEKANWISTVVNIGGRRANLGDNKDNIHIEGLGDLVPKLECSSSAFQDGKLVTGKIECRVQIDGEEAEQRNCFVNPRGIASVVRGKKELPSRVDDYVSIDQLEILCPLKNYGSLDDWRNDNMGA